MILMKILCWLKLYTLLITLPPSGLRHPLHEPMHHWRHRRKVFIYMIDLAELTSSALYQRGEGSKALHGCVYYLPRVKGPHLDGYHHLSISGAGSEDHVRLACN